MNCPYPNYDFCLWRGEDKEFFFSFSYQDENGTKIPMVLDGCTFCDDAGAEVFQAGYR